MAIDYDRLAAALMPREDRSSAVAALQRMPPDKLAGYARLVDVGDALALFEAGLGPKPNGVLIDWDQRRKE